MRLVYGRRYCSTSTSSLLQMIRYAHCRSAPNLSTFLRCVSIVKCSVSSLSCRKNEKKTPSCSTEESINTVYPDITISPRSRDIRILELLPGVQGTQISGKLVRYSLPDYFLPRPHELFPYVWRVIRRLLLSPALSLPYEALSYTWGPVTELRSIRLNHIDNFKVTAGLETILQALRLPNQPRRIWIDAICINQGDVEERNGQVQHMRWIYRNAKMVRVWLDAEVDPKDPAINKLQTLNDRSTEADLGEPSFWKPLRAVFKSPYWSRVWIQQEIVNATYLTIQCQKVFLPMFNLYHYDRLVRSQVSSIEEVKPDWYEVSANVRIPDRFGLVPNFEPLQNWFLRGDSGTVSLLENLDSARDLECTDDRDKVYGIMGLVSDSSHSDLPIKYEDTVDQVYTNVAKFIMTRCKSLGFIPYAGLDPGSDELNAKRSLPSWVPDWRKRSPRLFSSYLPQYWKEEHASIRELKPRLSADRKILHTHGMCVDSITELYQDDIVSATVMAMVKWTDKATAARSKETPGSFARYRYLLNDAEALSKLLHQAIRSPSSPSVNTGQHHALNENDTTQTSVPPNLDRQPSRPLHSQLSAHTRVDPGQVRSAAFTVFLTAKGAVGMALRSVKPGDEIWLLSGCREPVILRREADYHLLIAGEAYYAGASREELLQDVPNITRRGDNIRGCVIEAVRLR